MVICSYFLTNMCRFGQKCNNEHINVRLIIKTDAESALRGNQWPMSSFGPFRDRPSIPNFIEDQSFEEIRHLCYEAKNTGNVHAVTQQFVQQVNDAKNKINLLVNPSNDVVTLVTNIYNTSSGGESANTNSNSGNNNNNPFSMSATPSTNQNRSSIFGGGAPGSGGGGSGIFGAQATSAVSSNPFASNAAGFGANNNALSTQNTASLFGSSQAQSNGIFGGTNNSANTGSGNVFGSSGFASNTSNSLFGSANQNKPSIFGSTANTNSFGGTQTNATNLFGSPQQTSNIFGGSAPANPVFGASTSIFGQTNSNLNQQPNKVSVFGQNSMQSFGAVASQPHTSIFGGGNANQQPIQTSIFGQQATTTQNQASIFATSQNPQMPTTNIFGASSTPNSNNLFAAAEPPAATSNIFGGPQTIDGSSMLNTKNIFGSAQPHNMQQQQQSIFGSVANPTAQNQAIFGASSFQQPLMQQQPISESATLFSNVDALTEEEIAALNANAFELGKIPTKPPPRDCCA